MPYVSRAGEKLRHALDTFNLRVEGFVCADLGCNAGGFTDCMLQRGARKVFAIDTGYGMLDYKLRKDDRVVVMERTNAMHVSLPEPVDFVTIDVAWTKQRHILPAARRLVKDDGSIVTLVKPHYEADASELRQGFLPADTLPTVLTAVEADIAEAGFVIRERTVSPIVGKKRENTELLYLLAPTSRG
ncbi:MAG: SAM-dependent methyltransferase [Tepidisphaeraceae bacterium]